MGRPSLKEEIIMKEREHKSLMARGWRCSSIGKMLDGMPETLGLIPSPAEEAPHGITVLQSYHWEGGDRRGSGVQTQAGIQETLGRGWGGRSRKVKSKEASSKEISVVVWLFFWVVTD